MPTLDEIFVPKQMARMSKMARPVSTFLIDTFFKDQTPSPTKKVVIDFVKEGAPLAAFVHPKNPVGIMENDGYETKEFTTPLLAPTRVLDEERISTRMAGEDPHLSKTEATRAGKYVIEDLTKNINSIKRRMEWMANQAIFGGKIPIKSSDLDYEIDFGFTNKEVLEDKAKWNETDSDPLADILRWKGIVNGKSGRDANIAICSQSTMMAYIDHPKVKERLDIRNYQLGTVNPKIVKPFVTYFATDKVTGVDFYCYDAKFTDNFTDPKNVRENVPFVPNGSIALLPSDGDFRTFYGAITYKPRGAKNFVTEEKKMVAHSFDETRPDRIFTQVLSRPLPAPIEVDSWFVAQVL